MSVDNSRWLRLLIVLACVAVALHLGGIVLGIAQQFGDVITVFFLAWLLAFALSPVAEFIRDELDCPRGLAIGLSYVLLLAAIAGFLVLLLPAVIQQIVEVARALPVLAEQLPTWQTQLQAEIDRRHLGIDLSTAIGTQELASSLTALSTGLVQNAVAFVAGAANAFIAFIVIMIVSFYLILDGQTIRNQIIRLIPDEWQDDVVYFLEATNRTFGGFLRVMLIQSAIYVAGQSIVMLIFGLPYVVLSGLFAGVMMMIPFIGPVVALVPPIGLAVASGSLTATIVVAISLIVLQQIIFSIIAPKVMSDSLGLHPVLVFGALLVGTRVGGIAGAVFGVPIVAVLWAMIVLWVNRSRFAQLAAEREARAAQHPHSHLSDQAASAVRRVRGVGTIWSRLIARLTGRHVGASRGIHD